MSLVVPLEKIFENKTGLLANHNSWQRVELGTVCRILNGFAFKSSLFNKEKGFPIVRIRDLSKGATETFFDGEFLPEYIVDNGDFLIGMDGIFRCWEWTGGRAGLNQRVCKIIPNEEYVDRKFVLYGLNGYLKAIEDATSSVTVGHLSSLDVLRIPFPLPPLPEQHEIVRRVEDLFTLADQLEARYHNAKTHIDRLTQSILAKAFRGELVPQDPSDEPADKLLERIRIQKGDATALRTGPNRSQIKIGSRRKT